MATGKRQYEVVRIPLMGRRKLIWAKSPKGALKRAVQTCGDGLYMVTRTSGRSTGSETVYGTKHYVVEGSSMREVVRDRNEPLDAFKERVLG